MKRFAMAAMAGVSCALLPACGDSTGPSEDPPDHASSFAFNYNGPAVGSGQFNAAGEVDYSSDDFPETDFAGAARGPDGDLIIFGFERTPGQRSNVVLIYILDGRQPTTVEIDADCILADNCLGLPPIVGFGMSLTAQGDVDAAESVCFGIDATIRVTAVESDRVRGTVSATTGACIPPDDPEDITDFTFSNGSFDVGLVDVDDLDDDPPVTPLMSRLPATLRHDIRLP